MTFPITAAIAAALTLIYIALTYAVILARARNRIGLGDGGSETVLAAMRRQANFAENVPLTLILMALAEARGANAQLLLALGLLLVVARLLHPIGLKPGILVHPARFAGTATTTAVQLVLCALLFL